VGVTILTMCVTGVALTYEKQINAWFEHRDLKYEPASPGSPRLPAEDLIAKVQEQREDVNPSAITLHSDPKEPAEVSIGRQTLWVDPYTGAILKERTPSPTAGFFRIMEDWHRWFGAGAANRSTGKAVMDAGNAVFFFIVLSGLYLWFPRKLTWQHVRPSIWFRGGLKGKARDWNWHNTIGLWAWLPLVAVVGSGVIMSYQWANDLLYTATGSPIPQLKGPISPKGKEGFGKGKGKGGPEFAKGFGKGKELPGGAAGGPGGPGGPGFGGFGGGAPANWDGVNRAFARAKQQVAGWKSIRVQGSSNVNAPFSLAIDSGDGGQPQSRGTMTVNRQTGEVERWADFSSQSLGQRLRTLARFTHTGESLGFWGQTIAGLATLGGCVMVYTGLALSFRRWLAWRRRRRDTEAAQSPLEHAA